jgi:hypothetical protein
MNQISSPQVYRRHVHYVDGPIQRPLIAALVLLELVLVAGAIAVANWRLNLVVDESLYRVHITEIGPVWQRLALEAAWILGGFAAINIFCLVFAERLGNRFERQVLHSFRELIHKTEQLDYSSDVDVQNTHQVLSLALAWRQRERSRFVAVRYLTDEIRSASEQGVISKAQIRTAMQGLRDLIH